MIADAVTIIGTQDIVFGSDRLTAKSEQMLIDML
jgi:hypothetical protein